MKDSKDGKFIGGVSEFSLGEALDNAILKDNMIKIPDNNENLARHLIANL